MGDEAKTVVIDPGTFSVKAGVAGEDKPKATVVPLVGRKGGVNPIATEGSSSEKQVYVGVEVNARRAELNVTCPITRGMVTNWEDMMKIYERVFYSALQIPPEDTCVLVSEPCFNSKANREKATQIFFEDFNVHAFYTSLQPVLASYASGRVTGTVLDVGEGIACSTSIYEGYALPSTLCSTPVSGKEVTERLRELLLLRKDVMSQCDDIDLVQRIKEAVCYVATDMAEETKKNVDKMFVLPDGKQISIGNECFQASEILFNPSLANKAGLGLPALVAESVAKCDADIRQELFRSIVFAGGTTLLPGLVDRVASGVRNLISGKAVVRTCAPPERAISTWIGGSILASLSTYKGMWITKDEYEESGPGIVNRKCF